MVETGMELVGPNKRLWTGTVLTLFFINWDGIPDSYGVLVA